MFEDTGWGPAWYTYPTFPPHQKKGGKKTKGILSGSEVSFLGQAIILCSNLNWQLLAAINHLGLQNCTCAYVCVCVCAFLICTSALKQGEEVGPVWVCILVARTWWWRWRVCEKARWEVRLCVNVGGRRGEVVWTSLGNWLIIRGNWY